MFHVFILLDYKIQTNDLVFIKQKVIKIVHPPITQENILYLLSLKIKHPKYAEKDSSNTIVRLILAVLIGLLVGLVVNEPVLKAVMIIKQITGQIIFFLVPLIILGFVAPSIARLKSNASKVLLFAFSIAYLSSVGAATFGAVVGYELIPHLHIQTASEDLKDIPPMLFNLEIPPVMSVMSALVLAVMLGLSTAWVKSEEMERLLEAFQNMVLNW